MPILTAREPDLIVAGGTYWPLHHFAGEQQQEDMLPLLPVEQARAGASLCLSCPFLSRLSHCALSVASSRSRSPARAAEVGRALSAYCRSIISWRRRRTSSNGSRGTSRSQPSWRVRVFCLVSACLAAALSLSRQYISQVRNSPEITTRCDTGSHVSGRHRTWGLRTYVDQLNNGVVVAARMGGADLVDVKQAADAWQPEQMTTDGVHPRAWFQMELLNVYLNIAKGLRRQKKAAGEGSRRR